ncbi:hypothetical protein O5D80_001526 [Batrachochytrium dendrobatidis]|nr:hypothetical protein O5D80_001526 [Batrachochytrium dendrobatidis]
MDPEPSQHKSVTIESASTPYTDSSTPPSANSFRFPLLSPHRLSSSSHVPESPAHPTTSATSSSSVFSTTSGFQRKRSSLVPARSHYTSRSNQDLIPNSAIQGSISSSVHDVGVSLTSKEIRQQTHSWTKRELDMTLGRDYSYDTVSEHSLLVGVGSEMDVDHTPVSMHSDKPTAGNSYSDSIVLEKSSRSPSVSVSLLSQQVITHHNKILADSGKSLLRSQTPTRLMIPPLHVTLIPDSSAVGCSENACSNDESNDESNETSFLLPTHRQSASLQCPDCTHSQYGTSASQRCTSHEHSHEHRFYPSYWLHLRSQCTLKTVGSVAQTGIKAIPAVCLAVMLNLLDAMSYGIIVFPASSTYVPDSAVQSGISMFFASTIISQLIFTCGGSAFKGAVGSMMIEVMPFLHIMCETIVKEMSGSSTHDITATIMTSYAMSTLLTGIVFLILGIFKLGSLIQFFPRHILIGCIGGIGLFLIFTGIEVTSDIKQEFTLSYLYRIFELSAFKLWGTSLAIALLLKTIQQHVNYNLLIPIFYTCVPIVFYTITFAMGLSIETLRAEHWLFDLPNSSEMPYWTYLTYFDFGVVNWRAVALTIPTQLALIFFGILHVPINVPALAISTKQDVDLSWEIIGHGLTNIGAGLLGAPQNYLVYSNSLLYIRSGGGSRIGGFMLFFATAWLWIKGSMVFSLVPCILVGSLVFHLGIDLLLESVVHTWFIGINRLEYATILLIIGVMGGIGFTEGIVVGIIFACVFFVVMCSQRSIIRASFTGSQLRSTVHRLYRQQIFLDNCGDQIHAIRLQGFIFFGTLNQLEVHIRSVFIDTPETKFVVVDFGLIHGIDYSALESFQRIRRVINQRKAHLVFCGLGMLYRDVIKSGVFDGVEDDDAVEPYVDVHNFNTLNEALEWCENVLLEAYYKKSNCSIMLEGKSVAIPTNYHSNVTDTHFVTPRAQQACAAASLVISKHPHPKQQSHNTVARPVSILLQAFSEGSPFEPLLAELCGSNFELIEVAAGETLYTLGDDATELYVIEEGELVLMIPEKHGAGQVVETMLPGTMVGEIEMFTDRPRMCLLKATQDALLWRLSRDAFERLCKDNPALMLTFVTKIALAYDAVRYFNTLKHWTQVG